jgi:hypothetical protein
VLYFLISWDNIPVMNDSQSLKSQLQVLVMRDELMHAATQPGAKLKAEERAFQLMREICPEKLAPVLIQRNNSDFVAAYLIQRVGRRGWRFLVTGLKWHILRAKRSAVVMRIPSDFYNEFGRAVMVQGACTAAIEKLFQDCSRHEHFKKGNHAAQIRRPGKAGLEQKRPGVCQGRAPVVKRKAGKP